jgi:hypothetical protein
MKQIIKSHHDVITVPEAMKALMSDYSKIGYQIERITLINFNIIFPDGWVHVFWENGAIYQEICDNEVN